MNNIWLCYSRLLGSRSPSWISQSVRQASSQAGEKVNVPKTNVAITATPLSKVRTIPKRFVTDFKDYEKRKRTHNVNKLTAWASVYAPWKLNDGGRRDYEANMLTDDMAFRYFVRGLLPRTVKKKRTFAYEPIVRRKGNQVLITVVVNSDV